MQQLKIFQSLWAMELRSPVLPERTHEESFRLVSEAGVSIGMTPSVISFGESMRI